LTALFFGSVNGCSILSVTSSLNILLISSVYDGHAAISPLSSSEQAALHNFVLGGGSAILITDNTGFATAGNSFMNVFGVNATGQLAGSQHGTVTDLTSPVTNGPFGRATDFTGNYTGYFNSLGSYATSLGTWDANGAPALAAIAPGALGPGSGAVVFFSDSNQAFDTSNQTLMLNSIAYGGASVPEPSSLLLCFIGLAMAGGAASVRRRSDRETAPGLPAASADAHSPTGAIARCGPASPRSV
jgi:PEP-CTERM motif